MGVLVDFSDPALSWRPVNDGVMGGLSQSSLRLTEQGTGLFAGNLSLENNGGFASVRAVPAVTNLTAYAGVEIRVRGDGHTYQLRFRTNERFDGAAYRALFETIAGQWQTMYLPFTQFKPTFRGRILAGYPPLDTASLQQITLMVADRKPGPFRLEIACIRAVSP